MNNLIIKHLNLGFSHLIHSITAFINVQHYFIMIAFIIIIDLIQSINTIFYTKSMQQKNFLRH